MPKTIVVGLGNPILSDDGVGVKVVGEVEKALGPCFPQDVTVTEACVGGLRLMELLVGYERAILIDAFTGDGTESPGAVRRMTLNDLRRLSPTQHTASAHDTTLINALDTGRALEVPLPEEVTIYAINVTNVLDFAEEMTPAVAAAVPEVVTAVLQDLSTHQKSENGYTDGTD